MAAATILRHIQTADPTREVVVLTASDAETYVSRKFSAIKAAIAHGNHTGTPPKVTFSGATATINSPGETDATVTLELWGHEK